MIDTREYGKIGRCLGSLDTFNKLNIFYFCPFDIESLHELDAYHYLR
jgi:hypothetical protein